MWWLVPVVQDKQDPVLIRKKITWDFCFITTLEIRVLATHRLSRGDKKKSGWQQWSSRAFVTMLLTVSLKCLTNELFTVEIDDECTVSSNLMRWQDRAVHTTVGHMIGGTVRIWSVMRKSSVFYCYTSEVTKKNPEVNRKHCYGASVL